MHHYFKKKIPKYLKILKRKNWEEEKRGFFQPIKEKG